MQIWEFCSRKTANIRQTSLTFMTFIIVFKRSPSYTTSLKLANPAEPREAVGSLEICWENIDFKPEAIFPPNYSIRINMLTQIICLAEGTSLWSRKQTQHLVHVPSSKCACLFRIYVKEYYIGGNPSVCSGFTTAARRKHALKSAPGSDPQYRLSG